MAEKTSQTSSASNMPNVPAVAPTSDTPYIQPVIGKLGYDTEHPDIFGIGSSPDNGINFHVWASFKGLVLDKDDMEAIWIHGVSDRVKSEVNSATAEIPAIESVANEGVRKAESAIASSKVNSDAIAAQSEAISEAKSAMDSATAEIQQLKANAASDVAQIESTIAEVQTSINQAKSANESAIQAVQAELKSTSDSMDKVEKRLDEVDTSLDAYAKSAAEQGHDITLIKQKQGQFEADFASAQGNVNQIQADIKGLRQNIKDNQGNIATLLTSADKLQASMKDAQNNISNLLLTASEYEQTFKDQDGRLSKVEQTATEHTSELADAKGNLDKVTQKADNLQLLLSDAQKNIQNIQLDAKGLHDTLTGQSNQLASLNVTLNNLDSKYSGITGELQSKQTALSTEQQQTKDMLLRKADKSEVDSVKGTVNQVSAEQKTMADQINQKVSSVEYQTLKDKVNGMKIGTRNLLHHSDTFEGWHRGSTVSIAGSKYLNGTVAILAPGGSGGNALNADLDGPYDNQPITWAVYAKADNAGDKLHTELWGGGGLTEQPLTTEWQVYKFTGQRDARKHSFLLWGCVGNKGNIYVALPFAVVGNYIGTWLANPTDTITSINKNSTAIDENSKLISLKANQTDVDNIKGTAQQLSARLDVMAGEVKSKVDETRVNNIVDGKGFTTQSTVQSLIDQKAGTLNESITNLTTELKNNSGGGVNLLLNTGTLQFSANVTSQTNNPNSADSLWHLSVGSLAEWLKDNPNITKLGISYDYELTGTTKASGIIRFGVNQAPAWEYMSGYNLDGKPLKGRAKIIIDVTDDMRNTRTDITRIRGDGLPIGATLKITHPKWEIGAVTPYSQAPSDNASVTQVQQITASIDGLQSTVANKADKSQITQLSNVIQSKVSSSDFNDLKDKTLWKSTDSIDLNTAVSQQKIFVKGGSNLPPGGYWWYVRVEPGYASRIAQYAVSDRDNIHYSRQYDGKQWTAWSQGATESEITQLRDDINLRVKSGDLLSQINLTAHNTLIQSNKIYLDSSSTVFSSKAFIPSAAIVSLDADKITTGTLNGVHIHQIANANGRSVDIANGNISLNSSDPYESRISFTNNGKDAKMFNTVGDIEVINQEFALFNFTPEDTHSLNPIPFFKVTNTGQIGSGGAQLNMDHAIFDGYEWWTPSAGVTFGRTWNGVDKSSDYADIYAKSFVPHSELSAKTRIKKLDRKEALDKIMQDDMYTYQFKEDVRDGVSKRYASFIIDNIHDVAQYTEPEEFLSANGKGRDDGTQLAYLIAAVQYQQEQIEELKKKLEEK